MTVLDHTADTTGAVRHRLFQLYPEPQFVKQASESQLYGDNETPLPTHVFADPRHRAYPCHTKAATWLSALFLGDVIDTLSADAAAAIKSNIIKSAAAWGIQPLVEDLFSKMAADRNIDISQLPDTAFALVWKDDMGGTTREYPLRNAAEVEKSAEWFNKYNHEFNFNDRHMIATRILQKAAEFDVTIEDDQKLVKTAGLGVCVIDDVKTAWQKRAALLRYSNKEYAQHAAKIAAALEATTLPQLDNATQINMATIMDQFDTDTGLRNKYAEVGLTAPEEVLFQLTVKLANTAKDNYVQTLTGRIYEKSALAGITNDQLREYFGDDIADDVGNDVDVEKLAAIVETLPRPDAVIFDQLATAAGVQCTFLGKEAGHDEIDWHAEAARYQPA